MKEGYELNGGTLAGKLTFLAELKEEKKRLADLTKENNALIEQTEKETISLLLDMAEASGMDDPSAFTVTIDGRRYGVITKHYYNIKADRLRQGAREGRLYAEGLRPDRRARLRADVHARRVSEYPNPPRSNGRGGLFFGKATNG